ncbi:MAG: hypothetical protein ACHP84_08325 [Caulobacterales bacterium]
MNLFQRKQPDGAPEDRSKLLSVYKDGRRDERARVAHDAEVHAHDPAVRDAYTRGRSDERARRRSSPLIAMALILVAAAGGTILYLAAREGSFSAGGEVVDRQVAKAADATSQATKGVADQAGNALEGAGQNLKQTPAPSQK